MKIKFSIFLSPLFVMMLSLFVIAFMGGMAVAHYKIFPYQFVRAGARTLIVQSRAVINTREETQGASRSVPQAFVTKDLKSGISRLTVMENTRQKLPFLAFGGLNQYLEICPQYGCLAVAYNERGDAVQAWPYRPEEIFAQEVQIARYPREYFIFDPVANVYPVGILRYDNGDLLVNFQSSGDGIFPFGMGVARIAPDGLPKWTRFDYSHHWSTLDEQGVAYVPSLRIGDQNVNFASGKGGSPVSLTLTCASQRPQLDIVQVISGDGEVIREIDVLERLERSNWAGVLAGTTDPCDPAHLNFVDVVATTSSAGLAEGDLVLSLRNISRFAILDHDTLEIKRVVSGSFVMQHSVHHLEGSKFLIFDNYGGDASGPASRVLEVDIETGKERRVFPTSGTPDKYANVFSASAGHIDISPDRKLALISFTHAGLAFEVDVSTGELLFVYENAHDTSPLRSGPETAGTEQRKLDRFPIYGLGYWRQ